MDAIVDAADYDTRLRLRTLNRHIRDRVDHILAECLVWLDDVMYTDNAEGELRRHPLSVLNADLPRALRAVRLGDIRYHHNLRDILRSTKILDIRSPLRTAGHLPLSSTLSVLLLSVSSYDEKELAQVYHHNLDTLIVLDHTPVPAIPASYRVPSLSANLAVERQRPRRTVIHMKGKCLDAIWYFLFDDGCSTEHDDNELVLVGSNCRDTFSFRLHICLRSLLSPTPQRRQFKNWIVVNPEAEVRSINDTYPYLNNGSLPLTVGSMIAAMLEKQVGPKPEIRFVSLEEWAEELGPERFKLEMGL